MLADARIGAELKAEQERGDVATQARHPGSVRGAVTAPVKAEQIGTPRQRASEMKKLAARASRNGCYPGVTPTLLEGAQAVIKLLNLLVGATGIEPVTPAV